MRRLNGVYTQRFNHRHKQVGHLFQGRFKAILVDKDAYFLELCRYIVLNPVRAGLVSDPGDFAWSSYRSMLGLPPSPDCLVKETVLSRFGRDGKRTREAYQKFVQQGISRHLGIHYSTVSRIVKRAKDKAKKSKFKT